MAYVIYNLHTATTVGILSAKICFCHSRGWNLFNLAKT